MPITVALERSKETSGIYRLDSPDENALITSLYVRGNSFEASRFPEDDVRTMHEESSDTNGGQSKRFRNKAG